MVPGADRGPGRQEGELRRGEPLAEPGRATRLRELKRKRFLRPRAWPACSAHASSEVRAAPPRAGRAARSSSAWTPAPPSSPPPPPTCTPPTRRSARPRPTRPQEDHGAGRRPQPHRPGHRVRLLLRACRAGAARGRLRDHHGQLQPGDRLHRLRHLRPPVLRAADAGRRAGDRRQGEAHGRDRAVRRPDAAQAGARPGSQRRAHHRHHAGHDRPAPRTASASRSCCTSWSCSSRPTAPRATRPRRSRWRREIGYPLVVRPPTCWAAAPWRSCYRADGPGALHARGGARSPTIRRCCSTAS